MAAQKSPRQRHPANFPSSVCMVWLAPPADDCNAPGHQAWNYAATTKRCFLLLSYFAPLGLFFLAAAGNPGNWGASSPAKSTQPSSAHLSCVAASYLACLCLLPCAGSQAALPASDDCSLAWLPVNSLPRCTEGVYLREATRRANEQKEASEAPIRACCLPCFAP